MVFMHFIKPPQTCVKIPGNNSQFILLQRGTQQGCTLYPLLFALAIEPLSRVISNNVNINGYYKGKEEFKLSLYAMSSFSYFKKLYFRRVKAIYK